MIERQLAPARNNKTKENNMIDIDSLTIGEARRLVALLAPLTEPCSVCGEPHSCPHLMRRYDDPKITPFIPGRGRIMEVPRGEEPAMYEVVLVKFPSEHDPDRSIPKRVVALEMASGGCKTVGVVLRDPDFPDPTVWEEPVRRK